jgi:glycosyltransferase involved in cell wall biosynthesis
MLAYAFYDNDCRILQYTQALRARGHSVDVIALRREGQAPFSIVDGVRVHRIQGRTRNENGRLSYVTRIMRFFAHSALFLGGKHLANSYDLIHVHSVPDFLVFAALVPKLTGTPVILDIHDILPEFYASKFGACHNSFWFRLAKVIERVSVWFADHVIVANHIWRDRVADRSQCAGRCTAICNYPDTRLFFRRQPRIPDNRVRLIYPGTLNSHQGVDIAIRAFSRIAAQVPHAELQIYGDGPEEANLRDLVKSLAMEDCIHVRASVPLHEIAEIMANSDIAVVPKRVTTGFGNEAASTKILQFMALGVPVIVSRSRVDSYYFDDSVVQFFEPEDEASLAATMLTLIGDPELRRRLVENASRYEQQHRWETKSRDYLQIVSALAGAEKYQRRPVAAD